MKWDETKLGAPPTHLSERVDTSEAKLFDPDRYAIAAQLGGEYDAIGADIGRQWLSIVDDKLLSDYGRNGKLEGLSAAAMGLLDAADKRAARELVALREVAAEWMNKRIAESAAESTVTANERDRISFALTHAPQAKQAEVIFDAWRACASRRVAAEVRAWAESLDVLAHTPDLQRPVIGKTGDAAVTTILKAEVPQLSRELRTPIEIACDQAARHFARESERVDAVQAGRPGPLDMMSGAERRRARGDANNALLDKITASAVKPTS